jgi:hypothetical protein
MRKLLIVLVAGIGLVTVSGLSRVAARAGGAPQSASERPAVAGTDRFIGTWKLVSTEHRSAKGGVLAAGSSTDRTGFIIYDPAGYMAVAIMPSGRQRYAGIDPTPEEAQRALANYASYFGRFTVSQAGGFVTHHLQGSLNPSLAPDQKRFFEFSGNRLTLKPPPSSTGDQSSLTWERVPDLPNLTPLHRRFIGFWKHVPNDPQNAPGAVPSSSRPQGFSTGFIIYTAAGHVMVHLMQPDRQKYAGAQPTPEEARATVTTYTNYFGPYTLHEKEGYVVHHRVGHINPGAIQTDGQRFYQFSGNRLILKVPPNIGTGTPGSEGRPGTVITWERLSGDGGATR